MRSQIHSLSDLYRQISIGAFRNIGHAILCILIRCVVCELVHLSAGLETETLIQQELRCLTEHRYVEHTGL